MIGEQTRSGMKPISSMTIMILAIRVVVRWRLHQACGNASRSSTWLSRMFFGAIATGMAVWWWVAPTLPSAAATVLAISNQFVAAESTDSIDSIDSVESAAPSRLDLGADDISSEKVSQFVDAYLQVTRLIEQREGELSEAETDSESLRVQRDIEATALTLIEGAGLNWQEYIQLLGLANSDPEFGERIAAQLEEAIGN